MRALSFHVVPATGLRPQAPVAVQTTESGWTVRVDLPGAGPDDVQVDLDSGVLRIEAKIGEGAAAAGGRTVTAAVSVPDGVTAEHLAATMVNGVLTVTIAAPPGQRARIPVAAA